MGFKLEKSADFLERTHRPALGAFLRDIDGKIVGILQCRTLGTTLVDPGENASFCLRTCLGVSSIQRVKDRHTILIENYNL